MKTFYCLTIPANHWQVAHVYQHAIKANTAKQALRKVAAMRDTRGRKVARVSDDIGDTLRVCPAYSPSLRPELIEKPLTPTSANWENTPESFLCRN
jgi:hypothetical protein